MAQEDAVGLGYAYSQIFGPARGIHTLEVQDVVLAEHGFEAANSVLS